MKAVVFVVIAAVAILGLSYYFAESRFGSNSTQQAAVAGVTGGTAELEKSNGGVDAGAKNIYVPRKVEALHKAIAGHAGHINDDLLIMEGRSEGRLASREKTSPTQRDR